jgi:K+-transporting ATPase ATPase C chain
MKDHLIASVRIYLVLTLLLGVAYPAAVWAIGRMAFREAADGSLLRMKEGAGGDRVVGSALLGQSFHSKKLFHGRPSAAGDSGYDPTASGGTNLGPTSKKLADAISAEVARARAENPDAGLSPVPADLVTSSASGLDPHVSPENARWQVPRVAKETGLAESELLALVEKQTEPRFLGVFGEPRVNVLQLNLELLERLGRPTSTTVSK